MLGGLGDRNPGNFSIFPPRFKLWKSTLAPGQIFDRGRDPFPFKNLDWFRPSVDPGISFFKIGSNRPSVDPSFPFLKFGLNRWSVNPCVILLKLDRFVRLWVLASPFRSFYLIGRPWTLKKFRLPYFYFLHYRFESFCMTRYNSVRRYFPRMHSN